MTKFIWTGGIGVRQLLGYKEVSGSIPGVGNFSAWKCPDFRDNSRLGKGTIPENSGLGTRTQSLFQIVWVGVGEFLGKLRSGNRYTIQIFKNPWRTLGYSKKFVQPTEGNSIPGQKKFDHSSGLGPGTACSLLYQCRDLLWVGTGLISYAYRILSSAAAPIRGANLS